MTKPNKNALEEQQRKGRFEEEQAKIAEVNTWREELSIRRKRKFDVKRQAAFLAHLAATDRLCESAAVAGVSLEAVKALIKENEEFAAAYEEARYAYRDVIQRQCFKVAVEGVDEAYVAGRDPDTKQPIILTKKKYATDVLIMEAKRTNPEHREKSDVNLNVNGTGVLAVPMPLSEDEWDKHFAKPKPDDKS